MKRAIKLLMLALVFVPITMVMAACGGTTKPDAKAEIQGDYKFAGITFANVTLAYTDLEISDTGAGFKEEKAAEITTALGEVFETAKTAAITDILAKYAELEAAIDDSEAFNAILDTIEEEYDESVSSAVKEMIEDSEWTLADNEDEIKAGLSTALGDVSVMVDGMAMMVSLMNSFQMTFDAENLSMKVEITMQGATVSFPFGKVPYTLADDGTVTADLSALKPTTPGMLTMELPFANGALKFDVETKQITATVTATEEQLAELPIDASLLASFSVTFAKVTPAA